jgi:hypothetical protein
MRILVFLVLMLSAPWALAGVGVFTEAAGDTRIQRGEYFLAAAIGVEVEEDDIVETGDAAAQIEMNDGSVLKVGAGSRLLLADYQLDHDGGVLNAGIEVLSGWLRFAVAKLKAADRRYDIRTPTMTIGIRGTEGVIEAGNELGGLHLEEGEVAVHAAQAGSVPVRAGEYVERAAGRPFTRPGAVPPAFRARLPGIMQARVARRVHLLQQRGVPPRQIRRILREDRERYLKQHPHLRHKLEQRFRERVRDGERRRKELKERHPPRRPPPNARP